MDHPVTWYQACIKHLLSEYQALHTEDAPIELVFDDEHGHYLVMRVGWFGQKRVHSCLAHIDLRDQTIIIQANNTEDELDDEFVELGVPREQIQAGMLPPDAQEYAAQQRRERQQMFQAVLREQPEHAVYA